LLPALLLLVGCGSETQKTTKTAVEARSPQNLEPAARLLPERTQKREPVQRYVAELQPVNTGFSRTGPKGKAVVLIEAAGSAKVAVVAEGLSAGDLHIGAIHGFETGQNTSCPTLEADLNGDEVVDAAEVMQHVGQLLLPLASSRTPAGDNPEFPQASANGTLEFSGEAPTADLRAALLDLSDSGMQLEKYAVVLYGVGSQVELPGSVAAPAGLPPHLTIPVACGVFVRLPSSGIAKKPAQP
jgi:hypothetical protein